MASKGETAVRKIIGSASCLLALAVLAHVPAFSQHDGKWDGSRISPVHQIPLKDEFNQNVVPTEPNPLPFSSRYTCAPCHDYDVVRHGLHFNAGEKVPAGRPGEPWIWVDEKTGTLLLLSYRDWKGMLNPEALGLSAWEFTLMFGRHLNGGGMAEPGEDLVDPASRWGVSGKVEVNCLGCHSASTLQNHTEWAKQILRENFRWAATAASGLGEVGGIASRLRPTWDLYDGPNPDDREWAVVPTVKYEKGFFDSKHNAKFDIAHRPADGRCLACHSVAPVGVRKADFDEDVHTAAGLKCVSCHRNDISHSMVRGYEGESADYGTKASEDFTCAGCHLGGDAEKGGGHWPGRLGAPYPAHRGFPKVHFERLACTVCHSGPLPAEEAVRVRTSRANRLGIFGVARWATDMPPVQESVSLRDRNGKLAPHRLTWPAFWARIEAGKVMPLRPDQVEKAAEAVLDTQGQPARVLGALSIPEVDGIPGLVLGNKVFVLNVDGGLDLSAQTEWQEASNDIWCVAKDSAITPLVPDFDPASPETSADAEARIQKILEALAAAAPAGRRPVLYYKTILYQLTEGYLDKQENPLPDLKNRLSWRAGEKPEPLVSELAREVISETAGTEQTLTESQVRLILSGLKESGASGKNPSAGEYVYVSAGKMFRLSDSDALIAENHPAAEPVAWPLAHEVRPARQSLGIRGCTDCHKAGSKFFFSRIKGLGPLKTKYAADRSAHSFMGLDRPYQWFFGLSFTVRPLFKIVLFVSAVVIASILAVAFLLFLGKHSGFIEKGR